ncbi:MAG: hypothetical protein AAFX40_01855 [Cyanobacteria bacterium J06639_1]
MCLSLASDLAIAVRSRGRPIDRSATRGDRFLIQMRSLFCQRWV